MNRLEMDQKDIELLRSLASRVLEISKLEEQSIKRQKWFDMNALESKEPIILVNPENAWNEIFTESDLSCNGQLARNWERALRRRIYHHEVLKDDTVIDAFFDVAHVRTDTGWGLELKQEGGEDGGAYHIEPPVKDYERDFPQLKFPEIIVDYEATEQLFEMAKEIFGDILTVRIRTKWWWTLGMTWDFIKLRGLDNLMMDLILHPEWVHKMMRFLTDGNLKRLRFLEDNGLLYSNSNETPIGSGGFGYCNELQTVPVIDGRITTENMWGFCESQETVGVSPQMFGEFILPYQKEIMSKFTLNHYGCCEPIDGRWAYVKTIPNLRRVSASAWSDKEVIAKQLGKEYVISTKPLPTVVAMEVINEKAAREEIQTILTATKGLNVELIMKDTHTVGNNPRNLSRWVEIAREEVALIW